MPGLGIEGEAGTGVYWDDMSTWVMSPRARASGTLPSGLGVDAHYGADIVTSASVDVITAATSKIEEARHEGGLTVRSENLLRDLDADVSYSYSRERDADAHTLDIGFRQALWNQNVEVSLRGGTSFNRAGVADQPSSDWKSLWIHDVDLTLTFLLDRWTILELQGSAYGSFGYQANPYRMVPIQSGPSLRGANWLPELVPDRRLRSAGTIRMRRALGSHAVLSAEYRAYADDWGVVAHIESLDAAFEVVDDLTFRLRERGTLFGAARFYRERYEDATTYRTRDRRLSPNQSISGGLALEWEIGTTEPWPWTEANTSLVLSADAVGWNFPEFRGRKLTYTYSTEMVPVGWVEGVVVQFDIATEW